MKIGNIIKEMRKKAGFSQKELAESCHISQSYLSQIEKNRRKPHGDTLETIGKVLEIPAPILHFLSLDLDDIKPEKREAFELIYPAIQEFLKKVFTLKTDLT